MNSALVSYLPLVAIIAVFYFIIIRPQQKKQRARTQMMQALSVGDHVVTIGGVHGVVSELDDATVTLKVHEGAKIVFERTAINSIRDQV